jgi:hypothetical protein
MRLEVEGVLSNGLRRLLWARRLYSSSGQRLLRLVLMLIAVMRPRRWQLLWLRLWALGRLSALVHLQLL